MAPDDLSRIEEWLSPLIGHLDASGRGQLARAVATDLRRGRRECIER